MNHFFNRLILTLALALAGAGVCTAATVTISLNDLQFAVPAGREMIITPKSLVSSNGIVPIFDTVFTNTDAGGSVTLRMMPGTYQVAVQGPPRVTTFSFAVDPTNAFQNAGTNLIASTNNVYPPPGTAWTTAASDARYQPIGSGSGGVGITNAAGIAAANGVTNSTTSLFFNSGSTNSVALSVGEVAAARGFYNLTTPSSPLFYTNATSHYSIVNEDDSVGTGFSWVLVNPSNQRIFGTLDFLTWYQATNANPSTFISIFGTQTNAPTISILNQYAATSVIYVDTQSKKASDPNGQVGNADLPYATVQAACTVAAAMYPTNTTIQVSAGTDNEGFASVPAYLNLPSNCSLIGAGRGITILPYQIYVTGTNNVIANLSCSAIQVNACSNLVLSGIISQGLQDALFLVGNYSITGYDSTFQSPWDAWADYQDSVGGYVNSMTNSTAVFYNCNFINDSTLVGVAGPEPMILGHGKFTMYGGSVQMRAAQPTLTYLFRNAPRATNGLANLYNVSISYTNTLGASILCTNSIGTLVNFYGYSFKTNDVSDPMGHVRFLGNSYSGTFTGNGSGLTNVPALTLSTNGIAGATAGQLLTYRGNGSFGLSNAPAGYTDAQAQAAVGVTNRNGIGLTNLTGANVTGTVPNATASVTAGTATSLVSGASVTNVILSGVFTDILGTAITNVITPSTSRNCFTNFINGVPVSQIWTNGQVEFLNTVTNDGNIYLAGKLLGCNGTSGNYIDLQTSCAASVISFGYTLTVGSQLTYSTGGRASFSISGAAGNSSTFNLITSATTYSFTYYSSPLATTYNEFYIGTNGFLNFQQPVSFTNSIALFPASSYVGVVCTNGVAAYWNSNGVTYHRASAIGSTTFTDTLQP